MWPWRDWLITTLNDNMSFDRFTIEALAGDLIPNATMEQILGTADVDTPRRFTVPVGPHDVGQVHDGVDTVI